MPIEFAKQSDRSSMIKRRDLITAVVASIIASGITYLATQLMGAYSVQVERSQIPILAAAFVNDPVNRSALLHAMEEHGGFSGPPGNQGEPGEIGPVGPAWTPSGAIILVAAQRNCPDGSSRIGDFNLAVHTGLRANAQAKIRYLTSTDLATGNSNWPSAETAYYDRHTFKACHFE